MNARGVIIEATASFKVTWEVSGPAREIRWDQNKQYIELHDSDVYPDLEYYEASARATYVKYVSAARINDLLAAINARIDSLLSKEKTNEAEDQKELPAGPPEPKQLPQNAGGTQSSLVPVPNSSNNLPAVIEPGVTPNAPEQPKQSSYDYTVIVHAPKLRFVEGQRNTTTASAEILFKVSDNLNPELKRDGIDNAAKIVVEVIFKGGLDKRTFKFEQFEEDVTKFGGNLIGQVIPSIEVKYKAKEDVYAYGDEDSTEVKVTKAVRGDLEKLPEEKLKEIEDTILRIRNDRTAKKAREIDAIQQTSDK